MAFRTIVVDTHSKLEYSLEYLVFRTPDTIKRILLDEIHTLIIQSTAVSLTTALISELTKRKIKVIFCDEKQNPISEISPYYGSHNSSGRIFEQLNWSDDIKGVVWKRIIKEKILNQAKSLYRKNKKEEATHLFEFANEIKFGDETNREGHAAKVYFNSAFFKGFTRDSDCLINKYLNYGYTLILSAFNRVIASSGYLTQLGIHHKNEFNQFNLSCDLMEPFRYIIDDFVETIKEEDDWKGKLIEVLSKEVVIDGKTQTLSNAISIYCQSIFSSINKKDPELIKFIENAI